MKQAIRIAPLLLAASLGTAAAQDVREGAALYREFCATCHGVDGMGDGPMAGVLTIKPRDLTLLQANNDGIFPVAQVAARIDGRDPLVSHGSPMPVYGFFFEGEDATIKTHTGQPLMTSQPIVDLLTYLESLQND